MAQKFFTVDDKGLLHETTEANLGGQPRRYAQIGCYIQLTRAEIDELAASAKADQDKRDAMAKAQQKANIAKAGARAKLEALGLDQEEIDALAEGIRS